MPAITFTDVSVSFEERLVLAPFSLSLTEQRIAVIGSNGSGKSTLLRLINGLGDPTTGTVQVDGLDVERKGKEVRKRVGFIFSDAENQIVMPTVHDDIAFSLRRFKLPKKEKEVRVEQAMKRFQLSEHAEQSPHLLSGGQKQLLALAAVLVIQPATIIADEPTTLLDLRNRLRVKKIFSELDQQLIVATHDLDFIRDFDRAICINDHEIIADGEPNAVIDTYVSLIKDKENHDA